MIVYHAAKTPEAATGIYESKMLKLGRNVSSEREFVHVSLTPFVQGAFSLDIIGADTNEAWIFQLEIPDETVLRDDPSGEGEDYKGDWKVSEEPIPILRILALTVIPDVIAWECAGFSGSVLVDQ